MPTDLAEPVAVDSTLPRFVVPRDIRRWGAEHQLADRDARRVWQMLVETALFYVALVTTGETVDRWWCWVAVWVGLAIVMMRIDAVHHEAIHRSLFRRRWPNDVVAGIAGSLEGFHAPTYRCFHLSHHALTRRDDRLADPEGFYDEILTEPHRFGPVRVGARAVLAGGLVIGGITFVAQLTINAIASLVGHPPAYVRAASLERHVHRWGLLPFALWGGAIGTAVATGHVAELLRWWVVPMLVFLCGPYTFFALPEHYTAPHNATMLTTTGSVRSNAVYRWLTLDGNFHLAHHMFPNASWWRLDEIDHELRNVSSLRYPGYLAFYRNVWRQLSSTETPD